MVSLSWYHHCRNLSMLLNCYNPHHLPLQRPIYIKTQRNIRMSHSASTYSFHHNEKINKYVWIWPLVSRLVTATISLCMLPSNYLDLKLKIRIQKYATRMLKLYCIFTCSGLLWAPGGAVGQLCKYNRSCSVYGPKVWKNISIWVMGSLRSF